MKLLRFIYVFLVFSIILLQQQSIAQSHNIKKDSHPGNFYTIEKEYDNSNIDGYNIYVPKSCTSESNAFPIIVFLQGGLAVGGKVDIIFNWELPKTLKETNDLDSELNELRLNTFVFIMPHISRGQFYDADNANAIIEILDEVSEKYNVDENRIYLTGLSRGGHGAWGLACRKHEKFAAIAPISGAPHGIDNYDGLLELPIWTSHNIDDDVVDYKGTLETVKEIEHLSGKKFQRTNSISNVEYNTNDRIFISRKTGGHNAWNEMYNDAKFYKWLLRFHK